MIALTLADPFGSHPSNFALSALMSLNATKLPARLTFQGELASLHDQDRSVWDQELIARGFSHLSKSARGFYATEHHIEAMLAATHVAATSIEATDWQSVISLYDQLLTLRPSPIVFLNRAIAVGYRDGASMGLSAIQSIPEQSRLANYPFFWAAHAEFEIESGEVEAALQHFTVVFKLARNEQERNFFQSRMQSLS